jgi:hypothetical protein
MESDLYLQCRSLARKDGVNHHKKMLCALVLHFDSLEIEKIFRYMRNGQSMW